MRRLLSLPFLLLASLALACGSSAGGRAAAGATGGTGGGTGSPPLFAGVAAADAISAREVVLSWPDARNAVGDPGSANMLYRIYRAFDPASVQLESAFLAQIGPGITTYADTDAPAFTTIYYRVVAVNSRGAWSTSTAIAAARTPSDFAGGTVDYYPAVDPLWDTQSTLGVSCVDCHDGSAAGGRLDLTTWQEVIAGIGTPAAPDTFVIPYDGPGTWSEFVARFVANPGEHLQYLGVIDDIRAMQPVLEAWAFEGALEFPDSWPPVFEFDAIQNAGKYYAEWVNYNTVRVSFFHASDPESLPFSGSTAGQLEYHVYAGVESQSIDWLNPVAVLVGPDQGTNPLITADFTWTGNRVVIVVRAIDAAGRSVVVPPPNDPDYLTKLAERWRNMSVNEREIVLTR